METLIHEAALTQTERSDLLTIFAILMSMRDKNVAQQILQRRRQLMIESPFYEMIKQEGREEGEIRNQRLSLLDVIAALMGEVPPALRARIQAEQNPARLRTWFHCALKCRSIAEFEKQMES